MEQKLLQGAETLPALLSSYEKILLVHGRSFERSPFKVLFESAAHVDFTEFTPNPLYEDVCKGVAKLREEGCDAIVAVGGGSAIDVAKCIKLFSNMDPARNYLTQPQEDSKIPLVAIPTTAGTGSESTRHAVIYYEGNKQSISHPSIIPNTAVLIPELLEDLPVYQKKCTMLDALGQAIESWWSVNSTEESIACSKQAIAAIRTHWQAYIEHNSPEAAAAILRAANDAGRAINITATTAAHAMSYKLTSLYGLPHGHAVGLCLPEVWDYMLQHLQDCCDVRGRAHLERTLREIEEFVSPAWFRELLQTLQIGYPTAANREEDLEILTRSVNPVRLKNNPVLLREEALRELYGRIVKS